MFDFQVLLNLTSSPLSDFVGMLDVFHPLLEIAEGAKPFGIDTSIESMSSQRFGVGIFYFLIAAIMVFTGFVFVFMFKGKSSKLKRGEKILFAWLLFGIFVAVIFGAAQMLDGYLF